MLSNTFKMFVLTPLDDLFIQFSSLVTSLSFVDYKYLTSSSSLDENDFFYGKSFDT